MPPAVPKELVQRGLRAFHARYFDRGYPLKAGVYFHALEELDYDAFRACIHALREVGYTIADGPLAYLRADGPTAWISFDDNYRSWYRALSLFDELDLKATFYVNTGVFRGETDEARLGDYFDTLAHEGERVTLSAEELRALAEAGHTIGAHTHSHPRLSALPSGEAVWEMAESKRELEMRLGQTVLHFAYPFGLRRYFNEDLRAACQRIGFATVANAIPALLHQPPEPLHLQRQGWDLGASAEANLQALRIDGRAFERVTGRSAIG